MRHCMKLLCLLLLALYLPQRTLSLQRLTQKQHHARFLERAAARKATLGRLREQINTRTFSPIDYGADPFGVRDSSDAFQRALEAAFAAHTKELLPGVNDLGGAVLDLQGGDYVISKPIRFPQAGGGNFVIHGGTIRATADFPTSGYLFEQVAPWRQHTRYNPGVRFEDITYRDLLLDSGLRGGGIRVVESARTRVDNCYFLAYATDGILVEGGHETFVSDTFFGQHETVGGDPDERTFSGTAINLASNDNVLTDIAVFSAATGVLLRGQANMLTGVHCYNKATGFGGVGVYVQLPGLSQTRIDNCYMDYTGIVLEDPVQVHITNAFFLGDAYILLRSIKGEISGLTIVDNMFAGFGAGTPIVALDESRGQFTRIEQTVIDQNIVRGMALKGTVGRRTVAGQGTKWVVQFGPDLVFPGRIGHVQYSLYARSGGIPAHAVTGVGNGSVVVEAAAPVDAVVSVTVDQYLLLGEEDLYVSP